MKGTALIIPSKEQIHETIRLLDDVSKQRIVKSAHRILRRHPGLQVHFSVEDLIQEGLALALETRNWNPDKADFAKFISGNMRSFASNESRKNKYTRPDVLYAEDQATIESSELSETAEKTLAPPEVLSRNEDEISFEAKITLLNYTLSGDSEALGILNCLLDNKPKRDIRSELGLSERQYWAADRRLFRAVKKLGENYEKSGKT